MTKRKSSRLYYADECIPLPAVTLLRGKSFSIICAFERKFVNKTDPEQLKKSKRLKAVLVTTDKKDFWRNKEFNLSGHPGVIVLKISSATPEKIVKLGEKVLRRTSRMKLKESIIFASKERLFRFRWRDNKREQISWRK